ncbi:aminoglycoside phosphotransferase family protein [Maridesulfovibrio ferrireducens]|uniref:aminoglycoside phosphotransferase family protein n=1 Tax=Maridesulfovibrio ferrireducens TaxID=246191 RepID=UPI001A2A97C3|nr:aminoglycoside phosphotransferase family protein [Maridesulfovibrio ferrireducens]MBI9112104.1 aminoglycoside phosphotransferase family protein [Maridesulfovibrio ferrireducens]
MLDPLEPWARKTLRRHTEKNIPGSPERAISRSVIEDTNNNLWLMERIATKQIESRSAIARNLQSLHDSGLDKLLLYQLTDEESYIADIMGFPWQLSPYYESDELPRPEFIYDAERGEVLAEFLCSLREHGKGKTFEKGSVPFDLLEYTTTLVKTISEREPKVFESLEPICERLFPEMEKFPSLPTAFCHGDFHPLNVLWKGKTVGAVIDWEFSDMRPEIYDVANMVGCVAFENPDAFDSGLIPAFMKTLKHDTDIAPESFAMLPYFIPALRFAWLSEWLRKKDWEMLSMELDFMEILLDRT